MKFQSLYIILVAVLLLAACSSKPGSDERHKDYSTPDTSEGIVWAFDGKYFNATNLDNPNNTSVRYHYIVYNNNLASNLLHAAYGIGSVPTKVVDFETSNTPLTDYDGKCGYGGNLHIFDDKAGSHQLATDGLTFGTYFDFSPSAWVPADCFGMWHGSTISHSGTTLAAALPKYLASNSGVPFQFDSPNAKGSGGSQYWLTMYWQTPEFVGGKLIDASIHFDKPTTVHSIDINNNIWSVLAIENGSQFSKKFANNDWFIVRFKAYDNQNHQLGIMEVLLADFINQPNYVLKDWNRIPFYMFGDSVSSIHVDFTSSDNGAYGINTPTFILIDNVTVDDN